MLVITSLSIIVPEYSINIYSGTFNRGLKGNNCCFLTKRRYLHEKPPNRFIRAFGFVISDPCMIQINALYKYLLERWTCIIGYKNPFTKYHFVKRNAFWINMQKQLRIHTFQMRVRVYNLMVRTLNCWI